jgi:hypothetical protein
MGYFQEFMREQLLLLLLTLGLGFSVAAYVIVTWLQWAYARAGRA